MSPYYILLQDGILVIYLLAIITKIQNFQNITLYGIESKCRYLNNFYTFSFLFCKKLATEVCKGSLNVIYYLSYDSIKYLGENCRLFQMMLIIFATCQSLINFDTCHFVIFF